MFPFRVASIKLHNVSEGLPRMKNHVLCVLENLVQLVALEKKLFVF